MKVLMVVKCIDILLQLMAGILPLVRYGDITMFFLVVGLTQLLSAMFNGFGLHSALRQSTRGAYNKLVGILFVTMVPLACIIWEMIIEFMFTVSPFIAMWHLFICIDEVRIIYLKRKRMLAIAEEPLGSTCQIRVSRICV